MLAFKGDSIVLTYPATIAVIGKKSFLEEINFYPLVFQISTKFWQNKYLILMFRGCNLYKWILSRCPSAHQTTASLCSNVKIKMTSPTVLCNLFFFFRFSFDVIHAKIHYFINKTTLEKSQHPRLGCHYRSLFIRFPLCFLSLPRLSPPRHSCVSVMSVSSCFPLLLCVSPQPSCSILVSSPAPFFRGVYLLLQ